MARINVSLDNKIADYCEKGSFLSHLPEFAEGLKYVFEVYEKQLPEFG